MKQEKRASPRCFIQSLSLHFSQWSCASSYGWVLLQHKVLLHDVQMQSDDKMPSNIMNGFTDGEKDFKTGAVFPKLWYGLKLWTVVSCLLSLILGKKTQKALLTATCQSALRMSLWYPLLLSNKQLCSEKDWENLKCLFSGKLFSAVSLLSLFPLPKISFEIQ